MRLPWCCLGVALGCSALTGWPGVALVLPWGCPGLLCAALRLLWGFSTLPWARLGLPWAALVCPGAALVLLWCCCEAALGLPWICPGLHWAALGLP